MKITLSKSQWEKIGTTTGYKNLPQFFMNQWENPPSPFNEKFRKGFGKAVSIEYEKFCELNPNSTKEQRKQKYAELSEELAKKFPSVEEIANKQQTATSKSKCQQIEKSASKNHVIKLSKSQWQQLGKTAGWLGKGKVNPLNIGIKTKISHKYFPQEIVANVAREFIVELKKIGFVNNPPHKREGEYLCIFSDSSERMMPKALFEQIKQNVLTQFGLDPIQYVDAIRGPFSADHLTETRSIVLESSDNELPVQLLEILTPKTKYLADSQEEINKYVVNPRITNVEKRLGFDNTMKYTGNETDYIFEVTVEFLEDGEKPAGMLIGVSKDGSGIEVFQS